MGELLQERPQTDSDGAAVIKTAEEIVRQSLVKLKESRGIVDPDAWPVSRPEVYRSAPRPESPKLPHYDGIWAVHPDDIDLDPFEGSR